MISLITGSAIKDRYAVWHVVLEGTEQCCQHTYSLNFKALCPVNIHTPIINLVNVTDSYTSLSLVKRIICEPCRKVELLFYSFQANWKCYVLGYSYI
jgi:hypothetical protein